MLPQPVEYVLERLENAGFAAFAVGGCVRDALRGKPCDDIDITTNATPQEVTAVFGAENIIETGLAHGSRSSLSRCMSRYALGRPGAIRGNRFSVSDVGWML